MCSLRSVSLNVHFDLHHCYSERENIVTGNRDVIWVSLGDNNILPGAGTLNALEVNLNVL
jgi:hypothetical protein